MALMEIDRFTLLIKELAVYLGDFTSLYVECVMLQRDVIVDSIDKYDKCVLGYDSRYTLESHFLCLASSKEKSTNPYVKIVVENIFPAFDYRENPDFDFLRDVGGPRNESTTKWKIPYSSNADEYHWSEENLDRGYMPVSWRADIHYNPKYNKQIFNNVLKHILSNSKYSKKNYNIFWNLFLLAIDKDLCDKRLNDVIAFARLASFTEPMLRDWCRAVEYVMNGNQLSEDCDLQCETVEGRRFFLHKNE